ncbi:MAG: hypothetical protein EZS28_053805, partial [Streblomastix strix]
GDCNGFLEDQVNGIDGDVDCVYVDGEDKYQYGEDIDDSRATRVGIND